jgi:hypothetical protein
MLKTTCVLAAALSAICFSCASHPPPNDHLASAIAAVRGAQVAVSTAGHVPEAALHLKLAEEQVAQAREMMERGDHERADYMTLRAYNDAELALALARVHQARMGAQEATNQSAPQPASAPIPPGNAPGTQTQQ